MLGRRRGGQRRRCVQRRVVYAAESRDRQPDQGRGQQRRRGREDKHKVSNANSTERAARRALPKQKKSLQMRLELVVRDLRLRWSKASRSARFATSSSANEGVALYLSKLNPAIEKLSDPSRILSRAGRPSSTFLIISQQ